MAPLQTKTAGGVVVNAQGQVLVVNQMGKSWSLPKGHIEQGEEVLQAAIREITEESGLTELKLIKELGSYSRYRIADDGGDDFSEFKTIFMFLFTTSQTELHPQDANNPEARWVKPEEVSQLLTHRKDKEFFESIKSSLPIIAA